MDVQISPVASLRGSVRLPGDKSISHRYAMLSSLAEGRSRIRNYATGADCGSTLDCMRALGVEILRDGDEVAIQGVGLDGLRESARALDAGNSGSTIRMLSGVLAGQKFTTRIGGDESLSKRPMERIMKPLAQMDGRIDARDGRFPPLVIHGGALSPIEYALPVASAQVKSCVLFAGLYADGVTSVIEPVRTRDHSEIALRELGAEVTTVDRRISIQGRPRLEGRELTVPGDISSAAFFLVAATLVPGSSLRIENVGLNPTRAALLDFLMGMGAKIRVAGIGQPNGEPVGDLEVESAPVRGGVIEGDLTAALIDEIPALAVLGAVSEEGLTVRDARELRVKETDRIAAVAENLRRMGVKVEEAEDGFQIPGRQRFAAAEIDSFGDHRIAMAFSVAALAANGPCVVKDAGAASVS
ncbi:MAG: 3-phosphoshikimate 1-carboxyvinyltransferase, partial [bacterium]|nr:3-phosphoshikimate 1-carboxyvinyltransferase [bacterium]